MQSGTTEEQIICNVDNNNNIQYQNQMTNSINSVYGTITAHSATGYAELILSELVPP